MTKNIYIFLSSLFLFVAGTVSADIQENNSLGKSVLEIKQIFFEQYPEAFNPSLADTPWGQLLSFRTLPDPDQLWISYIGLVLLDDDFIPLSEPQIISTRHSDSITPPQAEDVRLITLNERVFMVYNDNEEITNPRGSIERRDIYIAELFYEKGIFSAGEPQKLFHEEDYCHQLWQKNWSPFVWNDKILFSYTLNPHEVIDPEMVTGCCRTLSKARSLANWKYGALRGGTQALLVDGEYLTFFHSANRVGSSATCHKPLWHYYMGACTFNKNPPFSVNKITHEPIIAKGFYTCSDAEKRVVFPGGMILRDNKIYVAYGKDDREIWIALFDKEALFKQLKPVKRFSAPLKESIGASKR